jgi:hypothetical protein
LSTAKSSKSVYFSTMSNSLTVKLSHHQHPPAHPGVAQGIRWYQDGTNDRRSIPTTIPWCNALYSVKEHTKRASQSWCKAACPAFPLVCPYR